MCQNNFDDFELSQEDFETISEIGMRHPYRGNLPVNFTPQYVLSTLAHAGCRPKR
jgi:hypothetical protein